MRRHNDSVNLNFGKLIKKHKCTTDSDIFRFTNTHLGEVLEFPKGGDEKRLKLLYQKHQTFINTGFDYIRGKIGNVSNSHFLPTYGFLLKCLKVFIPILNSTSSFDLYNKWDKYIRFYLRSRDFRSARGQIRLFLKSICLGIKHTSSRIPRHDRIHDKGKSILVLDLLMAYVICLCESDTVDVSTLSEVVEELNPWLIEFDKDMKRRKWLVKSVIEKIQFDDSEQFVQLFGLILLEHTKVCKDEAMVESGVELVLKKQRPFLLEVLSYLARKFPVEAMDESTNELDTCMMQLQSLCLHPAICITIQNILLYCHFEEILCGKSRDLLPVMNMIKMARTSREKSDNDYLANLKTAIDMLHEFDAKNNDPGPSHFMQAQALCLRALCLYEDRDSSLEEFIDDIEKALQLWSNNDLVDKDRHILHYTTKLLFFAFDVLIKEHTCHQLLKKLIDFFTKSGSKVEMLWQFKSHHNHLRSERYHNQLGSGRLQLSLKNYEVLIEEEKSTEYLESIASDISKMVPWSMELGCLEAQLRYDLGERMLLMGDMNEALKNSREGCSLRSRLIKESYGLPPNNQSGESVHALLMNPIVAARVWSFTSEDFLLAPNANIMCYLMSMHQKATILESMGNGTEALKILNEGKTISSQRGSSFLTGCFHAAIGKIYRKSQDFKLAKEELKLAKIQLNHITCTRCKLLLQAEINKESTKHMRMGLCSRDTEDDSELAEYMLQNDMDNSCKCWKHSCGFSLLNLLTEKGKDYIFKDDTRRAQDVFMKIINSEIINLVFSLSSPSESQTKFTNFVKFFEFVERSEIKFSYGAHVALIIYMISWAAYKTSINRRNEFGDHPFSIPIEKLIPSMKRALILSSEVPQLFEKVSQLLAIMHFFSHEEIPPSENISRYEWASFYHALTVNSGVNYSFSQRLRQVCGDRDFDPDKILNRLTHRGDPELDTFVTKFFKDLKPHTMLVINILGNKYKDLLKTKLKSFSHSECVALMMVSRLNSKQKPLVGLFSIKSGSVQKSGESSRGPWGTNTIVDTIAPEFKEIVNDFNGRPSQKVLDTINGRILSLLRRMESWFGPYKYILLGEAVGGPMTQNLDYLSGFIGIGLENASLQSTSSSYGSQSEGTSKRAPIILVLDKSIQMLPWERMESSKDQEFYRMPSVSSTFYTCYKNWEYNERNPAFSTSLDPFHAYYVINPNKSSIKKQCHKESQLADYFKGLGLEGSLWKEHVGDVIIEKLQICDLFIYSGHGDGLQYIPEGRAALAKLERCAAAILMGCMSGLLILKGPYTPRGAVLEYLLAGSPIVIGNLETITPGWALFLYKSFFLSCQYELKMRRGVGIGSCLLGARNASDLLMVAGNTVCYGVPTFIRLPV